MMERAFVERKRETLSSRERETELSLLSYSASQIWLCTGASNYICWLFFELYCQILVGLIGWVVDC